MSITICVSKKNSKVSLDKKRLGKLITRACKKYKVTSAVIEIEIVKDSQIRKISKKYLKKDHATDCISFDLTDERKTKHFLIIANAKRAVKVAKKRRTNTEAELLLYILHGLLHNLGLNDATKKDAAIMHKTEDDFLSKIGLGLVYNSGKL
jgi:probable rRNA maturation factor